MPLRRGAKSNPPPSVKSSHTLPRCGAKHNRSGDDDRDHYSDRVAGQGRDCFGSHIDILVSWLGHSGEFRQVSSSSQSDEAVVVVSAVSDTDQCLSLTSDGFGVELSLLNFVYSLLE